MTSATRYLCAAAYLSPRFASAVIREVLASRRAVVPSHGIDLAPIIAHCLLARKIHLARDAILTGILIAGLVVAVIPTIAVMFAALLLGLPLSEVGWERKPPDWRPFTVAGIAIVLAGAAVLWMAIKFQEAGGYAINPASYIPQVAPQVRGTLSVVAVAVGFPVLAATVLVMSSRRQARTLGEQFGPQPGPGRTFMSARPRTRQRIDEVSAAQEGNVTLFDGQNPFIGAGANAFAGGDRQAWSIAIEPYAKPPEDAPADKPSPRVPVHVDPVQLHSFLRDRLIALRDAPVLGSQQMPALTVTDHIAGEGLRRWGSPLIDHDRKIPYSWASPEVINALIRSPRDGLLYYQRVSVHDAGSESWAGRGVDVSAFIRVAAEGHTLFLEFIPAALPPIQGDFYIADRMPTPGPGFLLKVIQDTARTAFRDILTAPLLVFITMWGMLAERSLTAEADPASEYVCCDVGARISVRELAASSTLRTYTQQMEVAKYTEILERQVTQAVQEFLDSNGIDTAAYEASVEKVVSGVRTSVGTAGPAGGDATPTQYPNITAARTAWKVVTQVGELTNKKQR